MENISSYIKENLLGSFLNNNHQTESNHPSHYSNIIDNNKLCFYTLCEYFALES